MTTKSEFAAIVQEWAEGGEMEILNTKGTWVICTPCWWGPDWEYRIRPREEKPAEPLPTPTR